MEKNPLIVSLENKVRLLTKWYANKLSQNTQLKAELKEAKERIKELEKVINNMNNSWK